MSLIIANYDVSIIDLGKKREMIFWLKQSTTLPENNNGIYDDLNFCQKSSEIAQGFHGCFCQRKNMIKL